MLEEFDRRCDGLCSLPGCCYWRNTAPRHEDGVVDAIVSPMFLVSSGGFLLLPMADLVAVVVWPVGWRKSEEQKGESCGGQGKKEWLMGRDNLVTGGCGLRGVRVWPLGREKRKKNNPGLSLRGGLAGDGAVGF